MTIIIDGSNGTTGNLANGDLQVNGVTVGKGGGTVTENTAVGYQTLNLTGAGNVRNTAVGYQAGYSYTANRGTFIGYLAGYSTTGGNTTFIGESAGTATTTGTNNVALGTLSLTTNTTGGSNTALGTQALQANTTASNNTAVGYQALYTNATGSTSTALGYRAGYVVTTGGNVFLGDSAGVAQTSGSGSTFVGSGSGSVITTGNNNTILGRYTGNQGGLDIRTTSNYIVLSDGDGNTPFVCTDPNNGAWRLNGLAAGNYAGILQFCVDHSLKSEIYHNDVADRLTVQNDSGGVYLASGGTSWTSNSDERLKNITGEIQNGLSKVCTLRAAEYTWKADESGKPQVGLIAQDVLAILPQAVQIPPDGATDRDGTPAMMGISYTETIPLLVAAIKELKAEVDALKAAK